MNAGVVTAADPLSAGWAALRAFFSDGMAALEQAMGAFRAAEISARRSADPSRLVLWLLGQATALRYTRTPEPMEAGLERSRELVNLIARTQDEASTIPYRTLVEGIARDLADVIPAQASSCLADGLAYSERTTRLARKVARDEWLAVAAASRADLLLRAAFPSDRRAIRRAVTLHEDARRRWPARDPYGRAQASLGYVEALVALHEAAKAELIVREALAIFAANNDRYHEAAGRMLLSRVLYEQDQSDALDEQGTAVTLFRTLGCRWEALRAEGALP
jgi:hypothetical protein